MDEGPKYEFRAVTSIAAGAVGVPGRRTFFLLVRQADNWLQLWLEKEQLVTLSLAIKQLLALLSNQAATEPVEPTEIPDRFPVTAEFKVGRLALGYDEEREMVLLYAYELTEEKDPPPLLAAWATSAQMSALGEQSASVSAAGRPVCRLCGQSIDPEGHVCPRRNGHRGTSLQEELQQ